MLRVKSVLLSQWPDSRFNGFDKGFHSPEVIMVKSFDACPC